MNQNEFWMKRALAFAEKARGKTSPNPLVGALVVRNGKVVGQGFHPFFGGPHAEIVALAKAGQRARGATLYVTLEPCSNWGKTPPCVDAVIASGVKKVVIGTFDPNPQNHRAGLLKLKKAGLAVQVGILAKEVEEQNPAFFKAMRTGFPFVTLKMAQSLDGKIATRTGRSRWISSGPAREFVHELRSQADAVLVGKNTALIDNPKLQGMNGRVGKPWRIVLDPHLEMSPKARIFEGPQLTFLAVSEKKLRKVSSQLKIFRRTLLPVPERRGRLDLKLLLKKLVSLGVHHLLAEGGGELAWSLLRGGFVDRLIWITAPKIVGGRSAKTSVEGEGVENPEKAIPLQWEKVYRLGPDWVFEARCLRAS